MVLATIFVSLPFVVREVMPVLREIGDEQEQAASTLGASSWQTFWRITLPAIRWGVAYGVVLTTARCLGEFGAVSVVSGRIAGRTETMTTHVGERFEAFDLVGRLRGLGRARGAGDGDAVLHDRVPPSRRGAGDGIAVVEPSTKRFGAFVALDDVSVEVPGGSLDRPARSERQRQVDAAARHRRARARPTRARC